MGSDQCILVLVHDERALPVGVALQVVENLELAEYRAGGGMFDYE